MPSTLLLDTVAWDLVVDINSNIAVATEPYALAQDGASAIQTFEGEVYYDVSVGIDYFGLILGQSPPLTLVKAELSDAAETVPNVSSAQTLISSLANRGLSGQVQITSSSGTTSAVSFNVVNPQG